MINNMPFIGSELVAMHPIKDTWPIKKRCLWNFPIILYFVRICLEQLTNCLYRSLQ